MSGPGDGTDTVTAGTDAPEKEESRFDMRKATFYLVAFVFAINAIALFAAEIHCLWLLGKACWEGAGAKVAEGFVSLLASALAFAAGQQGIIRKV